MVFRCFNSKKGEAAIYVEAMENDGVSKIVADIEYDLQPLPRGMHAFDPYEGKIISIFYIWNCWMLFRKLFDVFFIPMKLEFDV